MVSAARSAHSLIALSLLWLSAGSPPRAQETMHHDHAPAALSTALTVQAGDADVTLSLADLQALPQTTLAVFNSHDKQNETYSGPLLADVLSKAAVSLSEASQHKVLDSYVVAAGTDGYFVIYSGAEVQPGLNKAKMIVAIAQGGQPLTRTGAFQLINSEDAKPARWVHNLTRLSVVQVTATH